MKNVILIFLIVFNSIFATGQQLPNNDFEEWNEQASYPSPNDWNTLNQITFIADTYVVDKSSDAYSGQFSARLETKLIEILGQSFLAPGAITLADFAIDILTQTFSYSGGYFLQQNVFKLEGMYKYQGVGNDSATVLMYNFRNREGEGYDTIGAGYTYLNDAEDWTPFTVNMRYLNGHVPDTFNVLFMSTTDEGIQDPSHAGSVLFLDSLTIHTNTGVLNLWEKPKALQVYPNPSSSIINFVSDETGNKRQLIISDQTGKMLTKLTFNEKSISYNLSKFSAGLYSYVVVETDRIVNSGTFIKE